MSPCQPPSPANNMKCKSIKFIGFIALFLIACQADPSSNLQEDSDHDTPDQISFDATLTTTSKGNLDTRIHYKRMESYSRKKEFYFMDGVRFEFYENGSLTSTIESKEACLQERQNHVEFKKDVHVTSRDGISLFGEQLLWDEVSGQMTSDSFVTIITAGADTIHGTGFESEKSFKSWLLRKPYGVTQQKLMLEKDQETN